MANKVTVQKEDLIAVLIENRDKHIENFAKAKEGYRMLVEEALEEKLVQIKAKEEFDMHFKDVGQAPESHADDYNNVIDMLGVAMEDTIQITVEEYMKFYKDDWDWHRSWDVRNSAYLGKFGV